MAKSVFWDQLSVSHPEQLKLISAAFSNYDSIPVQNMWGGWDASEGRPRTTYVSYPIFQQLQKDNRNHPVLGDLFAFKSVQNPIDALIDGVPSSLTLELVSGNCYKQLGVVPQLGRAIEESDDTSGVAPVGVISDELWTRQFGRSPEVVGKTITVNRNRVTIIGVNPRKFTGAASVQVSPDIFVPLALQPTLVPFTYSASASNSLLLDQRTWWLSIMGRTLPNIPDQSVYSAINLWLDQSVRATTTLDAGQQVPSLDLLPGGQGINYMESLYHQPVYVISSLTLIVYLLICLNLVSMLRTRSAARRREMAVRFALGAARGYIVRLVFIEILLLTVAAGCIGMACAYSIRNMIPQMLSSMWKVVPLTARFDFRVSIFVALIIVLSACILGLLPAYDASCIKVSRELKGAAGFLTGRHLMVSTRIVMTGQIALSTVLLIGAGLFGRTLAALDHADLGFDPSHLLVFEVTAPANRYPGSDEVALHEKIERRLGEITGVQAVTVSSEPVLGNLMSNADFEPLDNETPEHKKIKSWVNAVGEQFFQTYRIPILSGRTFKDSDSAGPRVAIINKTNAQIFFKNTNPIGLRFRSGGDEYLIVGVCADAKYSSVRRDIPPTFYTFYRQSEGEASLTYAIRTFRPLRSIQPTLENAIASVDATLPIRNLRTEIQQIDDTLIQERLFALIAGGFGVLAMILAALGVYGILAYDMSLRTREIGIRLALGAPRGRILMMTIKDGSSIGILGVALGVLSSYGVTRWIGSLLYGVTPADHFTQFITGCILMAIAVWAGYIPGRVASKLDPAQAVRCE